MILMPQLSTTEGVEVIILRNPGQCPFLTLPKEGAGSLISSTLSTVQGTPLEEALIVWIAKLALPDSLKKSYEDFEMLLSLSCASTMRWM